MAGRVSEPPPQAAGADAGSMRDPRTSTALRLLADLGTDPDPPRWAWAIARLEPTGRIVLPAEARDALGAGVGERCAVRGICHRVALTLRPDGAGAPMTVDGRGRVRVPAWLRRPGVDALLVGTHRSVAVVVVAPATVLHGLGDALVGESR